jgi:hypothetical protein
MKYNVWYEYNIITGSRKTNDLSHMLHSCPIDVPYLLRYETYMEHIWDIYGTSCWLPRLTRFPDQYFP